VAACSLSELVKEGLEPFVLGLVPIRFGGVCDLIPEWGELLQLTLDQARLAGLRHGVQSSYNSGRRCHRLPGHEATHQTPPGKAGTPTYE
jgi:hypothetical protein